MAEKRLAQTDDIYGFNPTSVAYNGNAVPQPERRPQPAPAPAPRPNILPQSEPRPGVRPRRRINFLLIALFITSAVMLIKVIGVYSELSAIAVRSGALKSEISSLEKEASALRLEADKVMPLAFVEQYARNQLGMALPASSATVFIGGGSEESYYLADETETGGVASAVLGILRSAVDKVWSFVN